MGWRDRIGLGLLALALGGAPAEAKTFLLLPAGPEAWTLIDPAAVERDPGGVTRRAWTVTVQRNILDGQPAQPGYVRMLSEYDCMLRQVRWKTFSAFSRTGDLLLSQENRLQIWKPAEQTPESRDAYLAVCGQASAHSIISADSIGAAVAGLMRSWDPPPATKAPLDEPVKGGRAKRR
jgi:hypothetical protein